MIAFNPKFTITNRFTAAITQIERARGFLEAARLSDDWVRDMGNKALIKEAHHTTHIEGTQLTLDQAERLWNGEKMPEADPEDTRELLNYRSAFVFTKRDTTLNVLLPSVNIMTETGRPFPESEDSCHRLLYPGSQRQIP